MVDVQTDWTEPIASYASTGKKITMVNSSLSHADKLIGEALANLPRGRLHYGFRWQGEFTRATVTANLNLEGIVQAFADRKFEGHTFFTDGDELFALEVFPKAALKLKKILEMKKDEMTRQDVLDLVRKESDSDDYSITIKKIDKEDTSQLVRTNHSIFEEGGGCNTPNTLSFISSRKRFLYATTFIEQINTEKEFLENISHLFDPSFDENPAMRPIRIRNPLNDKAPFTSTMHIVDVANQRFFVRIVDCKYDIKGPSCNEKHGFLEITHPTSLIPKVKISVSTEKWRPGNRRTNNGKLYGNGDKRNAKKRRRNSETHSKFVYKRKL